jgi:hypothetical protein
MTTWKPPTGTEPFQITRLLPGTQIAPPMTLSGTQDTPAGKKSMNDAAEAALEPLLCRTIV